MCRLFKSTLLHFSVFSLLFKAEEGNVIPFINKVKSGGSDHIVVSSSFTFFAIKGCPHGENLRNITESVKILCIS